jgi:DNA invertase Pin-like site-specific DNA recombinase
MGRLVQPGRLRASSVTGRLMMAVLGSLADVERDPIRTRTAEVRSCAKAQGSKSGCTCPHVGISTIRRATRAA